MLAPSHSSLGLELRLADKLNDKLFKEMFTSLATLLNSKSKLVPSLELISDSIKKPLLLLSEI